MTPRTRNTRGPVLGYVVGLTGMVVYTSSTFLPFYTVHLPGLSRRVSIVKELINGGSILGPVLLLYAGIAISAGVALVSLTRRSGHPELRWVFVAIAIAWALTSTGLLLTSDNNLSPNISHASGYYGMFLGVGVGAFGALIAMFRQPMDETAPSLKQPSAA